MPKYKKLSEAEILDLDAGINPCRVLRASRGGGMTQEELSIKLGKATSGKAYVSNLERGCHVGSFGVWHDICQIFGASLDEIAPYVREDRR